VANSKHFNEEERNKSWSEINRWAKAFISNKVLVNSKAAKREKFSNEMQSLIEQSGYNVVLAVRKQDPLKAAHGFEKFVKDYPKSKYAHRALYAAVVIFDEAQQLDLAISAGKRLLKGYPDSDRYNPTIGFLADFHTRVADFAKAARYNEKYYEKWLDQTGQGSKKKKKKKKKKRRRRKKKGEEETEKILITDKEAQDALYNAALLRESMGQFDKAIGNYVKYIKQFPDAKDVPDLFYKIGKIYERRKDWRKADRVWEGYPDKYAERSDGGRMLNVTYKHAMALRKQGKEKDSDKLLDKIIEQFNRLPEEVKSEEAREAVSHARFLQLEIEFNDYINIKLELPPRNLKKNLFKKIELRPKLERKYEEVVAYKDPDWSIGGLVRIGQISQNLSQSMYDAPIPAGLTPEQADIYVEELQKQALPLEEKAMVLYQKAIDVSNRKGLYNRWTIKAQEQIKTYRASAYPEAYKAGLVSTEYFYEQGPHTQKVDVPEPSEPVPLPPTTPAAGAEAESSPTPQPNGGR
jgi:TolA-binding protein